MDVKKFNQEVLFADSQIVKAGYRDIDFLKEKARYNRRKRIRLCAHKDLNDALHEMFIVHTRGTYVRPHKHINKPESLHIIEGSADVIFFDQEGNIAEVIRMGNYLSGDEFYYRCPDAYYHTLLIKSESLVFHEVTSGPFKKFDTIFPRWAPDEADTTGIKEFMDRLSQAVDKTLSAREKDR